MIPVSLSLSLSLSDLLVKSMSHPLLFLSLIFQSICCLSVSVCGLVPSGVSSLLLVMNHFSPPVVVHDEEAQYHESERERGAKEMDRGEEKEP